MIYLREISKMDLPIINKYRRDRELIEMLGSPYRYVNIETDEKWFESYQATRSANVRCAICLSNTGEMVGAVYLLTIDWQARSAEYAINIYEEKDRSKGIGKIATTKILEHAFNDLNLNRVYLHVLESNEKAHNFYKKFGFQTEGVYRQSMFKNGEYHNQVVMSLLKEEFHR